MFGSRGWRGLFPVKRLAAGKGDKKAEQRTEPPEDRARSKREVRRKRVAATQQNSRIGRWLERVWTQVLVVLALGGLLAFVIVFEPASPPEVPVEVRVGEPAPEDIRATRDYVRVQVDTTGLDERQAAAEALVAPVWDFDTEVEQDAQERISEAFAMLRRELKAFAEERYPQPPSEETAPAPVPDGTGTASNPAEPEGTDPEEVEPEEAEPEETAQGDGEQPGSEQDTLGAETEPEAEPALGATIGDGVVAAIADVIEEGTGAQAVPAAPSAQVYDPQSRLSDADLREFVDRHRDRAISRLQAGLDRDTLVALARTHFSPEVEALLHYLVAAGLSRPVVHSRAVLLAEQERGIALRELRDGPRATEIVTHDFEDFLDPELVPGHLAQALEERQTDLDEATRTAALNAASEITKVNVNTELNRRETRERIEVARASVAPETLLEPFRAGHLIAREGEPITRADYDLIQLMRAEEAAQREEVRGNEMVIGGVLYVLLVLVGVMSFGMRFIRRFDPSFKDLAFMTVTLLVMVLMTRGGLILANVIGENSDAFSAAAVYAAIPFAAGAMLTRVVLNAESGLLFAIVYSLLVALMLPEHPVFASYALVGSVAGTGAVEVVQTRMSLFRGGLIVGFVNVAFSAAMALLSSRFMTTATLELIALALVGGVLVSILVTALLPVVESTFQYISDFKLLELANPNHPALQNLMLNAPGSYQHSMMVATLSENACKAIGANALLARVGSYYHDIGKAKNPQYFAENQSGRNPHDKLKPHMSALIIKSHVKDGVEMAHSFGLPREIIRFIEEHHGTSLISFFFHKAKELEDPEIQEVDEKAFRYPGPKPQTPETAVCMLADGIEAASKAMADKTHARLQGLVQRMINNAFTDGQLDQSDLTLRDLDAIAREFIRILVSIHHQRPEYPDDRKDAATRQLKPKKTTEVEDASSDPDPTGAETIPPDAEEPAKEEPATLRRLGIDKGGAVDPPNRR